MPDSSLHFSRDLAMMTLVAISAALAALLSQSTIKPPALEFIKIGADSTAFNATATLIVGKSEVLLWDAQMKPADAARVADAIAATGKKLQAIVISHPDHDHYEGVPILKARFPGVPVYMTQAARDYYVAHVKQPAFMPDVLPSTKLTVDGVKLELIPDLAGDVIQPVNSVLWIPSMRVLLASDIAFQEVHLWLGSSDANSRAQWRASIARLRKLGPRVVIAGHKRDINAPDSPDVLAATDRYLTDFDSLRATAADAPTLRSAILKQFPSYAVARLVGAGAMAAFRPAGSK
jgi:glyoxylase-like metal-dependent hydrolase (beta-lactamase superfamily II)